MRDAGHQAVVRLGVDRRGPGAEARQQAVQPLVQHPGGAAAGRGEVPGGAVEEVLARVLDAGRLGARQGVPADEPLIRARAGEHALGRADVETTQSEGRALKRHAGERLAGRPRGGHEHDVGAPHGRGRIGRCRIDRAERQRRLHSTRGSGSYPCTCAPPRPRAAMPMEPPISPTPRIATFNGSQTALSALPASAVARSTAATYSAKSSARSACGPSQIASSGLG